MKPTIQKVIFSLLLLINTQIFAQFYFQDFAGGVVPANVTAEPVYTLSNVSNQLRIVIDKNDLFQSVNFSLPGLNLSNINSRIVSFNIRTDTLSRKIPFNITAIASDGTQSSSAVTKTIESTSKYRTITFYFPDAGSVNWSNIRNLFLTFNLGTTIQATTYLDDFRIGAGTAARPYFQSIPTQQILVNSGSVKRKILFTMDATILQHNVTYSAVSSNPALVPNPTFDNPVILSNSLFTHDIAIGGTAQLLSNRPVFMNISPVANQIGMANITVTATTSSTVPGITLGSSTNVFTVWVKRNEAPTIGTFPSVLNVGSGVPTKFRISNISNNNPEADQQMTISGISSDGSVLNNSNIVVSFSGKGRDADVTITPSAFGTLPARTTTITLTITDNGGTAVGGNNTSQINIPVNVFPILYKSPSFNNIPNDVRYITAGVKSYTITGLTDGNAGAAISSVSAVSSNGAIMANPTISYTPGNNYAVMTYNIATAGVVTVSVTATNFGAPANSNGNSSTTKTFQVTGLSPALLGYIEPFTVVSIDGENYYLPLNEFQSWRDTNNTVKWYAEGQGTLNWTYSINSSTGIGTISTSKLNGFDGAKWFAGLWYKPVPGGTFDMASFPYFSMDIRSTNTVGNATVAVDLWDVNNNRYGLATYATPTSTFQNYTFCFNNIPSSPNFDFSKVKMILFNIPSNETGAGIYNYQGTVEMRNLRLGNAAQGIGSCPSTQTIVTIDTITTRYYTSSGSPIARVITLTGVTAGRSAVVGVNPNPVTLSISSSGPITPSIGSVVNGNALLTFNTQTASTTTVTITGSASGATTNRRVLTILVENAPGTTYTATINNTIGATMPDGFQGQTMEGFGATLNGNVGGIGNYSYQTPVDYIINGIADQGMSFARMAIPPNFEDVNDNNDPNIINFDAFDEDALMIDQYLAYKAAGVERFIGTMWSIPLWTKYNKNDIVPNAVQWIGDNTLDSSYIKEVAEFCAAYVYMLKQKTGIELYAIDFVNEPQFNQFYASASINQLQYRMLTQAIGQRFQQEGIKTFIFGPETLPANGGWDSYIQNIITDPNSRPYLGAHAIHNYDPTGVTAGNTDPGAWGTLKNYARNANLNTARTLYLNHPLNPRPGSNTVNGSPNGIQSWQTETSGFAPNWTGGFAYGGQIFNSLYHGNCSGWTFWTFGGSKGSAYGQAYDDGTFSTIYYAQKHYSKYIRPGAIRMPASVNTVSGVVMVAFQNVDNTLAIVALNTSGSSQAISLSGTNVPPRYKMFQSYAYSYWVELNTTTGFAVLPPNSMTTFWGGGNVFVAATSVSVSGTNSVTVITSPGGTLQLLSNVNPATVIDKSVTWTLQTLTGKGFIDATGLLTGSANGTVRVRATSNTTPTVFGELVVTISGQYQPVIGVTVSGQGGVSAITTLAGTLQMIGNFNPSTASNQSISWSLNPSSGIASINSSGLLSALNNGIVTVIGTSVDNPSFFSRFVVTISGQPLPVSSATVDGLGGIRAITTLGGNLQMVATYSPSNATSTTVGWAKTDPSNLATINASTGLITANGSGNGTITITGTFTTWGISAIRVITISGQISPVTSTTITGTVSGIGLTNLLSVAGGSLQMIAPYSPSNANSNTLLTWQAAQIPGGVSATFNTSTGVLLAGNNGNGIVTITGNYGGVFASAQVTITGQNVPVVSGTVTGLPSNT
ncbi:MAG: glycoside hydrolase family 30 beta sandwich domain-containing protein, partial [Bacteroidota bacterium]|nr:glycoside hydrolase family 30 beta sandwich domain-containing protein [Bacteroidota bacterium]